ncbi:MAG: FAD binding domain-containing protein [Candidatus Hodarchaeales archaeon]|jgi:CO/xanthine dehydrogenase FAD-binding subunit
MVSFDILTPENLNDALKIKNDYKKNITLLGAGTDIIVAERNERAHFPRLLNIYNLKELKNIKETDDNIEIGSCVTHAEIIENLLIKMKFPVLAQAVSRLGCPQIRNRGTIGGNVCNASPAGDSIGPLYARDATVKLASVDRQRDVPVREFTIGPGETSIGDNEIVTGFSIPKLEFTESFYLTLRQRKSLACNKVSLAFEVVTNGKNSEFSQIRLAFGSVAPTVVRAAKTEELLTNKQISSELLEKAKEQAKLEVDPIDDVRSSAIYRREMCAVLLEKAIASVISL